MAGTESRIDRLTPLIIPAAEFDALPEYSRTRPSGYRRGMRWKTKDASTGRWIVCVYGPVVDDGVIIERYRPIVRVRAVNRLVPRRVTA